MIVVLLLATMLGQGGIPACGVFLFGGFIAPILRPAPSGSWGVRGSSGAPFSGWVAGGPALIVEVIHFMS